jgi:hypothetical protein
LEVDRFVRFAYVFKYKYHNINAWFDTPEDLNGRLLFHAKMYKMAEKYGAPGLKELAKFKFNVEFDENKLCAKFHEVIDEIYNGTDCSDRGLRDIGQSISQNPMKTTLVLSRE